jgi:UDP-glucose 4-epimerase
MAFLQGLFSSNFSTNFSLNQDIGIYDFEIGTGVGTSLFDLSNSIKYAIKSDREINFGEIDYRKSEIMKSIANISNNLDLKWKARIDLKTGISRLINEN